MHQRMTSTDMKACVFSNCDKCVHTRQVLGELLAARPKVRLSVPSAPASEGLRDGWSHVSRRPPPKTNVTWAINNSRRTHTLFYIKWCWCVKKVLINIVIFLIFKVKLKEPVVLCQTDDKNIWVSLSSVWTCGPQELHLVDDYTHWYKVNT